MQKMQEQETNSMRIAESLAIVKALSIHSKLAQLVRDGLLEERKEKLAIGDDRSCSVWNAYAKYLNGSRVRIAFRQSGETKFKMHDGTFAHFSVPTDVAHDEDGNVVVTAESLSLQ